VQQHEEVVAQLNDSLQEMDHEFSEHSKKLHEQAVHFERSYLEQQAVNF
jgi:hypothetical protein